MKTRRIPKSQRLQKSRSIGEIWQCGHCSPECGPRAVVNGYTPQQIAQEILLQEIQRRVDSVNNAAKRLQETLDQEHRRTADYIKSLRWTSGDIAKETAFIAARVAAAARTKPI